MKFGSFVCNKVLETWNVRKLGSQNTAKLETWNIRNLREGEPGNLENGKKFPTFQVSWNDRCHHLNCQHQNDTYPDSSTSK